MTPTQTFAWTRACAAAFEDPLRIVVVESDQGLLAAAPLAAHEAKLEVVGAAELGEPIDFSYRDSASLALLTHAVAGLRAGIVLPRLPARSPTLPALRRVLRGRGVLIVRTAGATPVLELAGDPEARFSGRRRYDLRRARRRAEESGVVQAEILSPSQAELGPLLADFYAVEAAGWKGDRGTALAYDSRRRRFFEEYAAACAAAGSLRLCRLRIGNETAAVQLAVENGRRLWLLKIGYDERFARSSPGTLLLLETARWATESGLEAIELLGKRDDWTRFWTDQEEACVAVHAYPGTLRGVRSLASDAVVHTRRHVTRRVVARAGLAHLAARELEGAIDASRQLADRGFSVILGYWDAPEDSPSRVESLSLAAVEALAGSGLDGYLSLKPAALGFTRNRIESIVERATAVGVPVHFDSTGPEDAEPGWRLLSELARPTLGCTLPGRWRRSLADAERAVELELRIRVVKGQWPDPDEPPVDERTGFLALADAVAGRARHVGIATHDAALAAGAIERLAGAGTYVERELMFGLPHRREAGVPMRIYVPFGFPSLPYAPDRARTNARVAGWVLRDLVRGLARRAP